MRGMTSCTCKAAGGETFTLHQPQRLEADIFDPGVIDLRFVAMTFTAEAHLFEGCHFARIRDSTFADRVSSSTRVAALALDAGRYRL